MKDSHKAIIDLSDKTRTAVEIGAIVGLSTRQVRKLQKKYGLPTRLSGALLGEKNHQFLCGRRIDRDGYALVSAPTGHPYARTRPDRYTGIILQHRLIMEEKLGRYLMPVEVVDHIDEITLHNDPLNLRLFDKNADHLSSTTTGKPHQVSTAGHQNIGTRSDLGQVYQPVNSYDQRKKLGEIRLQQILLAALSLGIDSPHLLGTHRYLDDIQIDYASHSSLERALADLYLKWERDHQWLKS